ncbi:MAG: ATP-dependent RecD-like DNA helicase [bacterium]
MDEERGGGQPVQVPALCVEGAVERIVFHNADNAYTVAALKPPDSTHEVIIVGNFGDVRPGEQLRVEGQYIVDKKYGRQFRVERFEMTLPETTAAIEKYLSSGLVRGIGAAYAKRLVRHFGAELFSVIDAQPERLREVEGIGAKRSEMIRQGWSEHRALRDIIMFLQQHGMTQTFAARIYKQYGEHAIEQIKTNPYQLAIDVRGIGFKSADALAQKMGIPVESVERCKAGVYFILQELAGEGHCYYPADPLIKRAAATLEVEQELVITAINALKADNHVVLELLPDKTRAVYLRQLHAHEVGAAGLIARLMATGKLFPKISAATELDEFEKQFHFELASNQKLAVTTALAGGVLVITGGPGTGKTTIIKAILRILRKAGVIVLLAAPTGRAAKRMTELAHHPAATIHRLLQYSFRDGGWQRNARNPLKADFVIVDEASMIDIGLAHALLRAVPATSSLIFVGDIDQLPSVGPGNFLRDLIDSGVVPVVRLNEIFRQARQSLIVRNAHRVNTGRQPVLAAPEGRSASTPSGAGQRVRHQASDFYFFEAEEPERALEIIRQLVRERIPAKFGFASAADIQVITPMHRGVIGAQNLNREIQQMLNPSGSALERGTGVLRAGDKVMQVENNYDKDVFNGDIGIITTIDREDQCLKVNFDGRIVRYEFNEVDEIELAYAVTVHKSQGSEYRAVIMPVHTTHFIMLQRNLLYTGITRGKSLVCLVGQPRAVRMAVDNVSSVPRHSALNQRLAQLAALNS